MLAHGCSSSDFHLFLIMQASAQDEFVEVESDTHSSSSGGGGGGSNGSSRDSKGGKDQVSKSNRKWWGQMGAAAKAALGGCANNKSSSTGRAAARAVNEQQMDTAQQQRQERSHQLVAAALEVLLRLTPLPPGYDSCFKSLASPDVSPVRSLAMPLLEHCDTVKALAGCIWSSWSDVQTKAVSQQLGGGGCHIFCRAFIHSLDPGMQTFLRPQNPDCARLAARLVAVNCSHLPAYLPVTILVRSGAAYGSQALYLTFCHTLTCNRIMLQSGNDGFRLCTGSAGVHWSIECVVRLNATSAPPPPVTPLIPPPFRPLPFRLAW